MKSICLDETEIHAFQEHGEVLVFKVINPQPERTRDSIGVDHKFWKPKKGIILWDYRFKNEATDYCPYQPGDEVWIKETWAGNLDDGIIYKANDSGIHPLYLDRWHSSITMPKWASRYTTVVKEVDVIQKGEWCWKILIGGKNE